jgi:hypothetical protein
MVENNLVLVKHELKSFLFAGNCLFTIANLATGKHFTYKLEAPDEQKNPQDPVFFVKVLTGPDNTRDYEFLGMVFSFCKYVHSRKSRINQDAPSEVAFVWLLARLLKGNLPECVQVYHHGRCGRCGHVLTVPSSIETGLGPECAAKVA